MSAIECFCLRLDQERAALIASRAGGSTSENKRNKDAPSSIAGPPDFREFVVLAQLGNSQLTGGRLMLSWFVCLRSGGGCPDGF